MILKSLNKLNKNTSIGYELPVDFENAETDEDDSKMGSTLDHSFKGSKAPESLDYDYFKSEE